MGGDRFQHSVEFKWLAHEAIGAAGNGFMSRHGMRRDYYNRYGLRLWVRFQRSDYLAAVLASEQHVQQNEVRQRMRLEAPHQVGAALQNHDIISCIFEYHADSEPDVGLIVNDVDGL